MTQFLTRFTQRGRRGGFTLVEMLVVVVILAILIGISVRIIKAVGSQKEKAITLQKLERLKFAIEEYYSEYGQYPPVDSRYVYHDTVDYLLPDFNTFMMPGTPPTPRPNIFPFIPSASDPNDPGPPWTDERSLACFGLLSHLMPRWENDYFSLEPFRGGTSVFKNQQWRNFNKDFVGNALTRNGPRDERMWERTKPFLNGMIEINWRGLGPNAAARDAQTPTDDGYDKFTPYVPFGIAAPKGPLDYYDYLLLQATVLDGWRRPFCYRSDPPHTTYSLWSTGGVELWIDDEENTDPRAKEARKRRIYGNVGY